MSTEQVQPFFVAFRAFRALCAFEQVHGQIHRDNVNCYRQRISMNAVGAFVEPRSTFVHPEPSIDARRTPRRLLG